MTEYEMLKKRTLKLLGEIISYESAKPDDEADLELIEECEAFMCELLEGDSVLSDAEIASRVQRVTRASGKPVRTVKPRRYLSYIAAVLCALLILCGSVCALHPDIRTGIMETLGLDTGDTRILYRTGDTVLKYDSMETLLVAHGLDDIMYPHSLPDGIVIESVSVEEQDSFSAELRFSGEAGVVRIVPTEHSDAMTAITEATLVMFGNNSFFVWQDAVWWRALTADDRYTYSISYCDEAGLYTVMEGFYSGIEQTVPAWTEAEIVRCTVCGNVDVNMKHGFAEPEVDNAYCSVEHHYHCIWTCANCGAEGTVSHRMDGVKHRYHYYVRDDGDVLVCVQCGYEVPR